MTLIDWLFGWLLFNANLGIFQLYHWNNSPRVDMLLHSEILFWFRANQSLIFLLNAACLSVLEPMIYHTQGEHANHYTTDALVVLERVWETVDEYLSVAIDSEDEKRICAAENRTMKKI